MDMMQSNSLEENTLNSHDLQLGHITCNVDVGPLISFPGFILYEGHTVQHTTGIAHMHPLNVYRLTHQP